MIELEQELKTEIATVRQTLTIDNVAIPEYQRPYKWSVKNVNTL